MTRHGISEDAAAAAIEDIRRNAEYGAHAANYRHDSELRTVTVAIHHAVGTNGGESVARAYFEHGVDTVIYIHVDRGTRRTWKRRSG